jgi:hypothetical protein
MPVDPGERDLRALRGGHVLAFIYEGLSHLFGDHKDDFGQKSGQK